jgi:HD superfamily phosphohydrolase
MTTSVESTKGLFVNNPLPDCLHDEKMWDAVHDGYKHSTNTQESNIIKEIGILQITMEVFDQKNESRYIISDFLGVGGVGIVFKVWDKILHTVRALKVARPMIGKEDLIAGLLDEEISRLQELSHPNLISIFDLGEINSQVGPLHFFTMTYVKGAINGRKYFTSPRSSKQLLTFLSGFLTGVEYLHSIHLLHLDLKPSNVFVGEDGFAMIGDLGGTRSMEGNLDDELMITCTSYYAHKKLLGLTAISSEDNRRRGKVQRRDLKYEFDRFSLGKSIFEILIFFDENSPTELSQYQRKYLQLQAARLLDGNTSSEERPLGLTEVTLERLKYDSIQQVCFDFDKMIGRANLLNEIPEISSSNNSVIQVTRGRKTRLTSRLSTLLEEPLIRRLGSVTQLGLARLVYPGATHTRLEHSLGVYSNAVEYIRALYNDPINPLFRQIMSQSDLIALLLAALLHDLGQYQHAHDLLEVEPAVFSHESLTKSLLKGDWLNYKPLTDSLRTILQEQWSTKPERIVEILDANPENYNLDIKNRILHTIISGPLDVDKLDYLLRDSDNCQAVYGNGLDRSRLLSTLTIVYKHEKGDQQYFALGIHEKGRTAAESLGFIRFQMFRSIYWHHTVRSAKAMLQRATFEWIAKNGYEKRNNDKLKHELQDFILQYNSKRPGSESDNQTKMFNLLGMVDGNELGADPNTEPILTKVGFSIKPQWSSLNHSDMLALIWLHKRTSELGRRLIEALAKRELYKRVFVISAGQEPGLWKQIQKKVTTYDKLMERSEKLRKALHLKVDALLKKSDGSVKKFYVSGLGDDTTNVLAAVKILGLEGTVLIDMPFPRNTEALYFSPEDLHRSQKEDFQSPSFLVVSELWRMFSEDLHELAGNIRIFVHPKIDVLRNAKTKDNEHILDSTIIAEELKNIFQI